jgi:hypothetical protein
VSSALAGIESLDAFFSSKDFHHAIQERRALVLAFSGWLEPQLGAIARLEGAVARARQRSPRPGTGLCMPVGVAAVSLPEGLLSWWQTRSGQLGPSPVSALLEGVIDLGSPPAGPNTEHYVLERGVEDGIQLGGASESLVGLLCAADSPTSPATLEDRAVVMGAERTEAQELLESLRRDGLLRMHGSECGHGCPDLALPLCGKTK